METINIKINTDNQKNSGVSLYAQFHFKFKTFNFKNDITGKVYRKGQFWDCFRQLALSTLNRKEDDLTVPGFTLIKNPFYQENTDTVEMLK